MTVAITLLVFLLTGVGFLLANLTLGRLVRPARPNAEKGSTYECGEPPVGPAWVQFDIRIYVAALIFLIFDVELAFFFPWATLFGSTLKLRDPLLSAEDRAGLSADVGAPGPGLPIGPDEAGAYAGFLFWEFLTFFALLLVAFAYLWRRGDLNWVRSQLGQKDMIGREKSQKNT